MLSSERAKAAPGLILLLFLSGCFEPMYAGSSGNQLITGLKEVKVDESPGRLGHYLVDALIFEFNGTGSTVIPVYELSVSPAERVQTPLVNTVTGEATSATLAVDAHYILKRMDTNRILTEGTAFTSAAYNRSPNEYANVTAAQNAEVRAANSLADQIRLRIAGFLYSDAPR